MFHRYWSRAVICAVALTRVLDRSTRSLGMKASNATLWSRASAGCPWRAFPTPCASTQGTVFYSPVDGLGNAGKRGTVHSNTINAKRITVPSTLDIQYAHPSAGKPGEIGTDGSFPIFHGPGPSEKREKRKKRGQATLPLITNRITDCGTIKRKDSLSPFYLRTSRIITSKASRGSWRTLSACRVETLLDACR